ncbi:MAG: SMC-Scp complex subunit ScpB [bacterium]
MDKQEIKNIIESLLFVSNKPVSITQIIKVIPEDRALIQMLINELQNEYNTRLSSLQIREIVGGYQICTKSEYSEWIKNFHQIETSTHLSKSALETLAIIAYKQPLTKLEIETIRGVNVDGVIETLCDKNLIKVIGRKKVIGAPFLYGTTKEFLKYFGLKDLFHLPEINKFKNNFTEIKQEELSLEEPINNENSENSENDEIIENFSTQNNNIENNQIQNTNIETQNEL